MALNDMRTWLVAYDIREPCRLQRVHRYLKRHAIPLQYSVFVTRANAAQLGNIRTGLAGIINGKVDDVRIYHIPDRTEAHTLGRMMLPEGVDVFLGEAGPVLLPFTQGEKCIIF